MEISRAINIAVGCVMASQLEMDEKREVIETLRNIESAIESISEDLEGQNVTPLVESIAHTLSRLGIYDND